VNPNPKGMPPIMIGDSTVLLPIPNLNAVGCSVNARGCRGFKEAIEVAAKLRRKGKLPHLVLVNDYGNSGVNPDLISEALRVLGKKRVLGLVTEYNADTGRPPAPTRASSSRPGSSSRTGFCCSTGSSTAGCTTRPSRSRAPGSCPISSTQTFTGADAYANFLAQVLPGGPPKAAAASADSDGGTTWWPFALAGVAPILGALFLVRRCVKS